MQSQSLEEALQNVVEDRASVTAFKAVVLSECYAMYRSGVTAPYSILLKRLRTANAAAGRSDDELIEQYAAEACLEAEKLAKSGRG